VIGSSPFAYWWAATDSRFVASGRFHLGCLSGSLAHFDEFFPLNSGWRYGCQKIRWSGDGLTWVAAGVAEKLGLGQAAPGVFRFPKRSLGIAAAFVSTGPLRKRALPPSRVVSVYT
jgi:hypothetical protein